MPPRQGTGNRVQGAAGVNPPAGVPPTEDAAGLVDPVVMEDFGRDKDLKALLKSIQPKDFKGEGTDIPKELEEWIMAMDDYFALAGYNALAQGEGTDIPKDFIGEGTDIPKELEEWIMAMDDYFALAGYNALAQGLMGRAKLEGPAKLWWKLQCQSRLKTVLAGRS